MPFMYILHILYICVPNLAYYLTFLNQILVHFTINSNKGFIKNKKQTQNPFSNFS